MPRQYLTSFRDDVVRTMATGNLFYNLFQSLGRSFLVFYEDTNRRHRKTPGTKLTPVQSEKIHTTAHAA